MYIYQGADKEDLSNNQEFLQLEIISSILLTLTLWFSSDIVRRN